MGEFQKQGFFRLFCGRDDLKENKRLHKIFSWTFELDPLENGKDCRKETIERTNERTNER